MLVAKRYERDLEVLQSNSSHLADPYTKERIPLEAIRCKECVSNDAFIRTHHRSHVPEYFVAINMGPYSGCHLIPFFLKVRSTGTLEEGLD